MKLPSVASFVAAILVFGLLPIADSTLLSSLALLPISAVASLGGVAGLKLAIAIKVLGMLGWWNVGRYGVSLRASLESNRLPEHVVRTPRPRSVFSTSTASVPIALLPYVIGGHYQKAPASIPVKKSFPPANRTARFDSPIIAFSANGFASVRGTKGSTIHASGELKSPLVNMEAQKTATLRDRRSIEEDPLVVEEAMELVRDLDTDECMLRLSCEVSADPPRYGSYGELVAAFINGVISGAVGSESAFEDFERAYAQGRSNGVTGCSERYSSCNFDLQGLVTLVEPPEAADVRNISAM